MVKLLLVAAIVFLLLLVAEYLWRIKKLRTEFTRKFVHITVGSFAAFWPWIISRSQIEIMALAFLVVIIASRLFTIFSSIHLIGRKTLGEIFFALSIGGVALITANRYIFMAALLQLSIADGLAAIIGTKYGKHNRYKIFGQQKSIFGSLTFLVCSIVILAIYFSISHAPDAWPTLLWLPLVATMLENIGFQGSDNVLVPLTVAIALRLI